MKPSFQGQEALRSFGTMHGTYFVFEIGRRVRIMHESNKHLVWPYHGKV